jgi:hypothetical protein
MSAPVGRTDGHAMAPKRGSRDVRHQSWLLFRFRMRQIRDHSRARPALRAFLVEALKRLGPEAVGAVIAQFPRDSRPARRAAGRALLRHLHRLPEGQRGPWVNEEARVRRHLVRKREISPVARRGKPFTRRTRPRGRARSRIRRRRRSSDPDPAPGSCVPGRTACLGAPRV